MAPMPLEGKGGGESESMLRVLGEGAQSTRSGRGLFAVGDRGGSVLIATSPGDMGERGRPPRGETPIPRGDPSMKESEGEWSILGETRVLATAWWVCGGLGPSIPRPREELRGKSIVMRSPSHSGGRRGGGLVDCASLTLVMVCDITAAHY